MFRQHLLNFVKDYASGISVTWLPVVTQPYKLVEKHGFREQKYLDFDRLASVCNICRIIPSLQYFFKIKWDNTGQAHT